MKLLCLISLIILAFGFETSFAFRTFYPSINVDQHYFSLSGFIPDEEYTWIFDLSSRYEVIEFEVNTLSVGAVSATFKWWTSIKTFEKGVGGFNGLFSQPSSTILSSGRELVIKLRYDPVTMKDLSVVVHKSSLLQQQFILPNNHITEYYGSGSRRNYNYSISFVNPSYSGRLSWRWLLNGCPVVRCPNDVNEMRVRLSDIDIDPVDELTASLGAVPLGSNWIPRERVFAGNISSQDLEIRFFSVKGLVLPHSLRGFTFEIQLRCCMGVESISTRVPSLTPTQTLTTKTSILSTVYIAAVAGGIAFILAAIVGVVVVRRARMKRNAAVKYVQQQNDRAQKPSVAVKSAPIQHTLSPDSLIASSKVSNAPPPVPSKRPSVAVDSAHQATGSSGTSSPGTRLSTSASITGKIGQITLNVASERRPSVAVGAIQPSAASSRRVSTSNGNTPNSPTEPAIVTKISPKVFASPVSNVGNTLLNVPISPRTSVSQSPTPQFPAAVQSANISRTASFNLIATPSTNYAPMEVPSLRIQGSASNTNIAPYAVPGPYAQYGSPPIMHVANPQLVFPGYNQQIPYMTHPAGLGISAPPSLRSQGSAFFEMPIEVIPDSMLTNESFGTLAPNSVILNKYKIKGLAKLGGTAVIRIAVDQKTDRTVAIKLTNTFNEAANEMAHLKTVRSPYVVELIDSFELPQLSSPLIVLEHLDTSLYDFTMKKRLDIQSIKLIFSQILYGLEGIHSANVVHCDLKPQNIMLLATDLQWKIIDFGNSKFAFQDNVNGLTPMFCPPEVAKSVLEQRPLVAQPTVDMWQVGVILYFLFTRSLPFEGQNDQAILKRLSSTDFCPPLEGISDVQGRNVLKKLLVDDPKKRMTLDGLKKSAFLNSGLDTVQVEQAAKANPNIVGEAISSKLNAIASDVKEVKDMTKQALSQIAATRRQMFEHSEYKCPRLMMLVPKAGAKWNPKNWVSDTFHLCLLCEHDEMHFTEHPGYSITEPKEFVKTAAPILSMTLSIVSVGLKLTTGLTIPTSIISFLSSTNKSPSFSFLKTSFDDDDENVAITKSSAFLKTLEKGMGDILKEQASEDAEPSKLVGSSLRNFEVMLNKLDSSKRWGGLQAVSTESGEIRWSESVYFKSADSHSGHWKFNLKRLNLHLLPLLAQSGACAVIDSTKRGKRYPDALSKTIPIWCCVINRWINRKVPSNSWTVDELALHTLPSAVSRQEHSQIESLIDGFVQNLLDAHLPLPDSLPIKPLRPLWINPHSHLFENHPLEFMNLPFTPVICLNASEYHNHAIRKVMDLGGSRVQFNYIPGAGDDEETWSRGWNSILFWQRRNAILEALRMNEPLDNILHQKGQHAEISASIFPTTYENVKGNVSSYQISGTRFYIGSWRCTSEYSRFDFIINCTEEDAPLKSIANVTCISFPSDGRPIPPEFLSETLALCRMNSQKNSNPLYVQCNIPEGKKGKYHLLHSIPILFELYEYLSENIVGTPKVLVHCKQGIDRSVGILLAFLYKYHEELLENRISENTIEEHNDLKWRLERLLVHIQQSYPRARPTRVTMKQLYSYFTTDNPHLQSTTL